jgi:erythritol transport system ATP-binding protein
VIVLQACAIRKVYGATVALDGVDFDVHAGAVNVLIGENGAGKSTLMKILAGVTQQTDGELLLDGHLVRFDSVRDAAGQGIGMVHQELNLCPNLTVTENIFLGRERSRGGVIDHTGERTKAVELLARLGAEIDPDAKVESLRIGQQQIVEIARALAEDARILIMDEPTSALSATEVETLFRLIGDLRRSGVAIIYISHRLEELLRIGDHITVLRDGKLIASEPVKETSLDWIIEHMLGEAGMIERREGARGAGETVLVIAGATVRRPDGTLLVDHFDGEFRAGEITCIYGLLGAGRTELLEWTAGLRRGGGSVRLNGEDLAHLSLAERVERRLLLVPEDRQRDGLLPNLSVGGNLGLAYLAKLLRLGVVSRPAEAESVRGMIGRLGIKAQAPETPIGALSGGNQQKVVIGRCLMPGPAAILLDEPSRGIDVGARAEVFETMRTLAAAGIAVVFTTSDLTEALTISDRILVLANGRLTADLPVEEADEPKLVRSANGQSIALVEA